MDYISELNANQVAKELQNYKRYQGKTQKDIKEKVGGVNDLRDELRRLEKKSKSIKSVKSVKSVKNKQIKNKVDDSIYESMTNESILPNDVERHVLLYSDIDTIVNYCTSNTSNINLCNDEFWKLKFNHDKFPLHSIPTNFYEWVKLYRHMSYSKKLSVMLIKVLDYYNFYQNNYGFYINHDKNKNLSQRHNEIVNKLLRLNDAEDLASTSQIKWEYKKENEHWVERVYIPAIGEKTKWVKISDEDVINTIFNVILSNDKNINITDMDDNNIEYEKLKKNGKKNKSVSRAYLMAYQIMFDC
jgi:hypothetical protein